MREIIFITLGLLFAGWIASKADWPPEPTDERTAWVHTVDGWERPSAWAQPKPLHAPPLHPLVIAALELLASLAALVAFAHERGPAARRATGVASAEAGKAILHDLADHPTIRPQETVSIA